MRTVLVKRALFALFLPLLVACSPPLPAKRPAVSRGVVPEGTPDGVNIALARGAGGDSTFAWRPWDAAVFAEARRDRKWILVDGAAEWCHWCHVMDETTYRDPEVGRLLRDRFVAIRVDVDQRPDIEERYGAWGWPATILLSPDAEEIGKYKGYLRPDQLRAILADVGAGTSVATSAGDVADTPATVAALPWVAARASSDLDQYWDPEEGGWGRRQKAPLGENIQLELLRAAHGDGGALSRARLTLAKQRAVLDPVWGGVYQYSAGKTWDEPHFEKLMPVQTATLVAYARGFQATGDPTLLADAQKIAGYVERFLTAPSGAFLVSQDADVNAHDKTAAFVDGHIFYAKDDAGRRALGMPRIDDHIYPHENGLAIAAFVAMAEATGDHDALDRARRAADEMLRTRVAEDGGVRREDKMEGRFLVDAAALGFGLARLAEITREPRYRDAAVRIAARMLSDLDDGGQGGLLERTLDPAAAGVFARRRRPFVGSVLAARFLAALTRVTSDPSHDERGKRVLAAISTPRALDGEGRLLGGFLLACVELGVYPWPSTPPLAQPPSPLPKSPP